MKVMMEQKQRATERHSQFIADRLNIVGFSFNTLDHLIAAEGNASHYFSADEYLGNDVISTELFPFLVGLDTALDKEIPYVELPNGAIVDAFIQPTELGYDVVLIDTHVQREKHQQVQQIANVTSLEKDVLADENTELSAENEAKSKFISTFSHELKTPLASILGYSDLLKDENRPGINISTNANAIHRNGIYLLNLINNVLEQGRVDINQTTITTSPVVLSELMESVIYLVQPLADKKKLNLSTHFGCPKDLLLILDEQHLSQVLVNLITNAIKFSEDGFINLEVSYLDRELQFVVSDTGIGIPEDELVNIMQPFGRAKHTQHIEGAGIGLSLSNTLVMLMGGELQMQSKLGEGTVVTVKVPTTEAIQAKDMISEDKTVNHGPILVAEDDEDLVPLIGYYLEEEGYDVLIAMNQTQLHETLKQHKPAMILMDHNFREADGVELTKDIIDSGYQGKVIMLTASSGEAIIKLAMNAGCSDFITKPIDREKLILSIALHLND